MTPETKARTQIDRKLTESGYVVQDFAEFNPVASLGVVVREYPTSSGPVDYLIFVNKIPCGVIEAKKTQAAESLTSVAEQSKRYIESDLKFIKSEYPLHKLRLDTLAFNKETNSIVIIE